MNNMSETNIIKSIVECKCPKCGEDFFIESQMQPSLISALFTKEDVMAAKKDCLSRIEALSIDDEKKNKAKKWLEEPSTIFAPAETENIILSLLKADE